MSEVKVPAPATTKVQPFAGRIPAFWSVLPVEDELADNLIEARNSSTGETFTGTVAEFNDRLKG